MKAKLVRESLESHVPEAMVNIILDIGEMVKHILDLNSSVIKDIHYNKEFHRYEGLLTNVGELLLGDLNDIRYEISLDFPEYEENIQIQYDRNTDGLIISLAA